MRNEKLHKGSKKRDHLGNIGACWRVSEIILKKQSLKM
jgi:hypothetical protein